MINPRYMIALGLGLLTCALPLQAAVADWEYTKWGMTPEQVAAASHGLVQVVAAGKRQRIDELKQENGAEGSYTDEPLKLNVNFRFDTEHGGLVMVFYSVMNHEQNDQLKDWLIRKYGPPQTSGGLPVIGLATFQWNLKDEIDLNITTGETAFVMHSPIARK